MTFAAGEEGHHGAPLTGLLTESSGWPAARPAFKGGSRRQHWAAPSCMLALHCMA